MKKEWQSIHLLHSLFLTAHSLFLLLLTLSFTCCSLSFFLLLSSSMSFPFHLSIFLTLFFFSSSLIYLSLQQQWDDHNDETTRIMRWPWGWDKNEVEMQDNFFSCCLLSLSLAAHSLFSCCSLPLCLLLFAHPSFSLTFSSPLCSSLSLYDNNEMTMMTRLPGWWDNHKDETTMRMRHEMMLSLAAHSLFLLLLTLFFCCSLPLCLLLFAHMSFSLSFSSPLHSTVSLYNDNETTMMTRLLGQWDGYKDEMKMRARCKTTMRTRWPQGWDVSRTRCIFTLVCYVVRLSWLQDYEDD